MVRGAVFSYYMIQAEQKEQLFLLGVQIRSCYMQTDFIVCAVVLSSLHSIVGIQCTSFSVEKLNLLIFYLWHSTCARSL